MFHDSHSFPVNTQKRHVILSERKQNQGRTAAEFQIGLKTAVQSAMPRPNMM
jgi:hypothetical protein